VESSSVTSATKHLTHQIHMDITGMALEILLHGFHMPNIPILRNLFLPFKGRGVM